MIRAVVIDLDRMGGPNHGIFSPGSAALRASASRPRARRQRARTSSRPVAAISAAPASTKPVGSAIAFSTTAWNASGLSMAVTETSSVQARWAICMATSQPSAGVSTCQRSDPASSTSSSRRALRAARAACGSSVAAGCGLVMGSRSHRVANKASTLALSPPGCESGPEVIHLTSGVGRPNPLEAPVRLDMSGIDPVDHALARRCSVGDIPTRAAATFSGRTALTDEVGSWTFDELESHSNRFAHGLLRHGIEAEEPVAILSTNCREFVATYFGTAKAGMVSLPVNLLSGLDNIAHALTDSGTRIVVVHSSLAEMVVGAVAALPAIRTVVVIGGVPDGLTAPADGPALIGWDDLLAEDDSNPETVISDRQIVQCLYSSGTTSRPKGVLTSHLAVTVAALGNGAVFGLNWGAEPSVTVCPLPLFHTAGLNGVLLSAVTMGTTVHLLPGFEPAQYADTVARVRATHLVGLPLMLEALADGTDRGLDLSSVQFLLYAMAPMSAEMRG